MRFNDNVFRGRYSPIGVDFGTTNLKLLQFREERKKIFLHRAVILPRGIMPIGKDKEYDAGLALKIKKKLKEAGFIIKRSANICLGNGNFIIRSFKLPAMNSKDISDAIKWEAEYRITAPSEERMTDYLYERVKSADGKENITVHLVAASRSSVSDYLFIMSAAGLRPLSLEVEPFSMNRIFKLENEIKKKDKTENNNISVVVDLGGENVNVLILEDGNYAYCRQIKPGMNLLYAMAASGKEVPAAKTTLILPCKERVLDMPEVCGIVSGIVAEIRQTIDNYCYRIRDREGVASCEQVHLCGGGAEIFGIESLFKGIALKGVDKFSIFDSLDIVTPEQFSAEKRLLFNVAGGLALRGWLKK